MMTVLAPWYGLVQDDFRLVGLSAGGIFFRWLLILRGTVFVHAARVVVVFIVVVAAAPKQGPVGQKRWFLCAVKPGGLYCRSVINEAAAATASTNAANTNAVAAAAAVNVERGQRRRRRRVHTIPTL